VAHTEASVAPLVGFLGALLGIALGVASPIAGVVLAVAFVPFRGGSDIVPFGLAEFFRGAPLWGAVGRLLVERIVAHSKGEAMLAPSRVMTAAAIAGALIAPLQRLTAISLQTFPAQGADIDMLSIIGSQSLFFGTWLAAAHLPAKAMSLLSRAIGVVIAVALFISLAAWIGFKPLEFITFDPKVFGRLATLGYPTPTAMGLAIALPLAAAAVFARSRLLGAALVAAVGIAIILTESRGPMIAVLVIGLVAIPTIKFIRGARVLGLLGALGLAGSALFFNRYGDRLDQLLAGNIPNLDSDLQRITSWRAGIETALAHPITGGGWFSLRYWNDSELGKANVNLSHNIILQSLSDGGFPLGIAAAIVVVGAIVLMVRQWGSIPISWRMAAIAVVVCGLWDMPQMRAFGALFAGLALGLVSRPITATAARPGEPTGPLPQQASTSR
jgi:O-antigen ligase